MLKKNLVCFNSKVELYFDDYQMWHDLHIIVRIISLQCEKNLYLKTKQKSFTTIMQLTSNTHLVSSLICHWNET